MTDLHGDRLKYDYVLELAREHHPDVVINGGDITANEENILMTEYFISDYLNDYFTEFDKLDIHYLVMLGNDDYRVFDDVFDELCAKHPRVHNIAQRKVKLRGYEFIGFNWVVDYPFRLKDRCRMDTRDYQFQEQYGTGLLSSIDSWIDLPNWTEYAASLPTIEDELRQLAKPNDMRKAVYVIHMPPVGVGMDKCAHGAEVGSRAVYEFIQSNQPLLTLHGHIHESPDMTGIWKNMISSTLCIQPGQQKNLKYVLIDLDTMNADLLVVANA